MRKILATMMALALTIGAQGQQDDGLDAMMAAMIAAKNHQDSIDTSSLVAVYDYECQTQDADGKPCTVYVVDGQQLNQHFHQSKEAAQVALQFLNYCFAQLHQLRRQYYFTHQPEDE